MEEIVISDNVAQTFTPWHGGGMGMCGDGEFGGGTATLKWHSTETSSGVTIGTLTDDGAISATSDYMGGFISFEFDGATNPSLKIFYGQVEHPATIGKWKG